MRIPNGVELVDGAILGVPELTPACWLQAGEIPSGRKGGDCDLNYHHYRCRDRHHGYGYHPHQAEVIDLRGWISGPDPP